MLTVLNQGEISFVHNLLWHGASVLVSSILILTKTFMSVFLTVFCKLLPCQSAGLLIYVLTLKMLEIPYSGWYLISFPHVFSCTKLMEEQHLQTTNFRGPSETPSKERSLAILACLRAELYREYKNQSPVSVSQQGRNNTYNLKSPPPPWMP